MTVHDMGVGQNRKELAVIEWVDKSSVHVQCRSVLVIVEFASHVNHEFHAMFDQIPVNLMPYDLSLAFHFVLQAWLGLVCTPQDCLIQIN